MVRSTLLRAAALAVPLLLAPAVHAAAPKAPAAASKAPPAKAPAAAPAQAPAAKPALPAGWSAVDAADAGFTAAFPGAPERQANAAGKFKMVAYGFETQDPERSFMVIAMFGDVLAGRTLDEVVLPKLREDAEVVKDEAVKLDGRDARALHVKGADSEIVFRRVGAYDRQFLIAVRVPAGQVFPAEDARRFFESFRFRAEVTLPDDLSGDGEDEEASGEEDGSAAAPPAVLPPARPAQGFAAFQAKDAGFAVKFPGEPKRAEDASSIDYEAGGADGTCKFTVMTFRHDEEVPAVALDVFVSQMAGKFGRGMTRNEKVTVGGLDGRAVTVAIADERIEARILRHQNRMYVLLVGGSGATPPQADLDAFFGSFRLLE
jgi:hypothetical protein